MDKTSYILLKNDFRTMKFKILKISFCWDNKCGVMCFFAYFIEIRQKFRDGIFGKMFSE